MRRSCPTHFGCYVGLSRSLGVTECVQLRQEVVEGNVGPRGFPRHLHQDIGDAVSHQAAFCSCRSKHGGEFIQGLCLRIRSFSCSGA